MLERNEWRLGSPRLPSGQMRFALHAKPFAAAAEIMHFVRARKILTSVLPQYCAGTGAH
jgi:hypothetical protein